jgi:hypothetical protein
LKAGVCVVKVGTPVEKCPTTGTTVKTTTTSSSAADCQKLPKPKPKPQQPSTATTVKTVKHSKDYMRRYIMGWNVSCGDDMKMTQYKATSPHSKAFTDGYKDARTGDGPCPY